MEEVGNKTSSSFMIQVCEPLSDPESVLSDLPSSTPSDSCCGVTPTSSHSRWWSSHSSLLRKMGAEFIATFLLIYLATGGPMVAKKYYGVETPVVNSACSALPVMVVILAFGHLSGAHVNPSVTLAFAVFRHFPWARVPAYILAQVMGSICASFTLKFAVDPSMSAGVTVPSVNTCQAFAVEVLLAFFLTVVITAVATDTRAVGEMAGIAVGATVMVNILVFGPITGASMNPVRTLGPAMAACNYTKIWIYMVAPTLGALAGAGVYEILKQIPESESPRKISSFNRRFSGIEREVDNLAPLPRKETLSLLF